MKTFRWGQSSNTKRSYLIVSPAKQSNSGGCSTRANTIIKSWGSVSYAKRWRDGGLQRHQRRTVKPALVYLLRGTCFYLKSVSMTKRRHQQLEWGGLRPFSPPFLYDYFFGKAFLRVRVVVKKNRFLYIFGWRRTDFNDIF